MIRGMIEQAMMKGKTMKKGMSKGMKKGKSVPAKEKKACPYCKSANCKCQSLESISNGVTSIDKSQLQYFVVFGLCIYL